MRYLVPIHLHHRQDGFYVYGCRACGDELRKINETFRKEMR